MTASQFIAELESANPRLFAARRITITVESFRDQLRRAHAAGMSEAMERREPPPEFFDTFLRGFSKPPSPPPQTKERSG